LSKSENGGNLDIVGTSGPTTYVPVTITPSGSYTNNTGSNQNVSISASIDQGQPKDPKGASFFLTVTCTPAPPQTGPVTIAKTSVGGIGSFLFTQTAGPTAIPAFTLTTVAPGTPVNSPQLTGLATGDYDFAESLPGAGWTLTSVSCTQNSGLTGS